MIKKQIILLILILPVLLFSKAYKGAELRTKESFLYGKFQVCYKASAANGHTSTFFTYNDIDPVEHWNEIDIEILGRYNNDVQFNTITPQQGFNHVRHQYVDFNPCTDFHTYTIEWTPDYVAWFIDGSETYRQTGEHISTLVRPQKIMMNIWNPVFSNWVGPWDERILPRFAYYDYVSYATYTPGTGHTGTDNNFTLQWKDTFDSFDAGRWDKATHTFSGNNCDFIPENIVYRDGLMILCLTDDVNTGYVDVQPPAVLWARAINNQISVGFTEELDRASAEDAEHYRIIGTTIASANLQPDLKSVLIKVDSLDAGKSYNLIALGIQDDARPANTMLGQVVKINSLTYPEFPFKINIGGTAADDYHADQQWSENNVYGYSDGDDTSFYEIINGGEPASVYRYYRYGLVSYKVRVPNGTYTVTLKMAEYYFDQPGKRLFDIYIQGKKSVETLDIFKKVGYKSACELTFDNIKVNDQIIHIHFAAHSDLATLSGLIIEQNQISSVNNHKTIPGNFNLEQNFPNPFNPLTNIIYHLKQPNDIQLKLYNTHGQLCDILADGFNDAGLHQLQWDGADFSSGIYLLRMTADGFSQTRKIVLTK